MAISGHSKVAPDRLEAQAKAARADLDSLRDGFSHLKELMDRTAGFWTGEAADSHRNRYKSEITRIQNMLTLYEQSIRDLEVMAGVYRSTETSAARAADSLPASRL